MVAIKAVARRRSVMDGGTESGDAPRDARPADRWGWSDMLRLGDTFRLLQMREMSAKQVFKFLRRLEPIGGILFQKLVDDLAQPLRDFRVDQRDRLRCVVNNAVHRGDGRVGAKRRPSSTHRVENAAEAEQVGTVVDSFA